MSNLIQELIDRADSGATVKPPPGQYNVDVVGCGVNIIKPLTLDLTGVVIQALPTDQVMSIIININAVNDVSVINASGIVGEASNHIWPSKTLPDGSPNPKYKPNQADYGGQGFGIFVAGGARNVRLINNNVSNCFGDGIYVDTAYNVEVRKNRSLGNRRQAMSVIAVDGIDVIENDFSNTGHQLWTPPGCGNDFECNGAEQIIANVNVSKNNYANNVGSHIAFGTNKGIYKNIRVFNDNIFDGKSQPIWVAAPGVLGTPWWAFLLNRSLGWMDGYRWWGYPTSWYRP